MRPCPCSGVSSFTLCSSEHHINNNNNKCWHAHQATMLCKDWSNICFDGSPVNLWPLVLLTQHPGVHVTSVFEGPAFFQSRWCELTWAKLDPGKKIVLKPSVYFTTSFTPQRLISPDDPGSSKTHDMTHGLWHHPEWLCVCICFQRWKAEVLLKSWTCQSQQGTFSGHHEVKNHMAVDPVGPFGLDQCGGLTKCVWVKLHHYHCNGLFQPLRPRFAS